MTKKIDKIGNVDGYTHGKFKVGGTSKVKQLDDTKDYVSSLMLDVKFQGVSEKMLVDTGCTYTYTCFN